MVEADDLTISFGFCIMKFSLCLGISQLHHLFLLVVYQAEMAFHYRTHNMLAANCSLSYLKLYFSANHNKTGSKKNITSSILGLLGSIIDVLLYFNWNPVCLSNLVVSLEIIMSYTMRKLTREFIDVSLLGSNLTKLVSKNKYLNKPHTGKQLMMSHISRFLLFFFCWPPYGNKMRVLSHQRQPRLCSLDRTIVSCFIKMALKENNFPISQF